MSSCPNCGAALKSEARFCPKCGAQTAAAAPPSNLRPSFTPLEGPSRGEPSPAGPFALDKYLFNQKIFSVREQYYVFDEGGNEVFFVRRKLFALKRHITFYFDRSMASAAFAVKQKRLIELFSKSYDVVSPGGELIGRLRRRWFISLFRRTWDLFGPGGESVAVGHEDSWLMAFVRRHIVPWKVDFVFEMGGREIGRFTRRITLFDKYVLDLTGDPEKRLDRRMALALGVLMDAEEGR